jgi:hypothetical protein
MVMVMDGHHMDRVKKGFVIVDTDSFALVGVYLWKERENTLRHLFLQQNMKFAI